MLAVFSEQIRGFKHSAKIRMLRERKVIIFCQLKCLFKENVKLHSDSGSLMLNQISRIHSVHPKIILSKYLTAILSSVQRRRKSSLSLLHLQLTKTIPLNPTLMLNKLHQKHNVDIQTLIKQPWGQIHMFVCLQKNQNMAFAKKPLQLTFFHPSSATCKYPCISFFYLSPVESQLLSFLLFFLS